MPARSKAPKPPAPPKPWRREDGVYRSSDDRFTIEGGGAGRWFVTDGESLDELGLARTLGPYDTLDDAKAAADAQRDQGAQPSPLAARLAAAKASDASTPDAAAAPRAKAAGRGAARRHEGDADAEAEAATEGTAHADEGSDADAEPDDAGQTDVDGRDVPAASRRTAKKPAARSWLEELEDDDPEAAARARRAIAALERFGAQDADGVVRRDVLGRQPAVAARLLGRSIAEALRARLEPGALDHDARAAIPGPMKTLRDADEAALAAYAAFVAARVLDAVLGVVAVSDRAEGAGRDLPGWRLVERPAARNGDETPRRLIVTPADVAEG
jgi:hypothetical protein